MKFFSTARSLLVVVGFLTFVPSGIAAPAEKAEPSQAMTPALSEAQAPSAQPPSATDPASTGADSASTDGAASPSQKNFQEARARFDRGLQLYADGDYQLALIEFDRAYLLVNNYRVLYNIGQVSIQLRRYARARQALEQYLQKGGVEIPDQRRQEVLLDIERLKSRTAHVAVVLSQQGAQILVDGAPVATTPLKEPLLLAAGKHSLQARAPGYDTIEEHFVLAGGDRVTWKPQLTETKAPVVKVENRTIVVEKNPELGETWLWLGWGTTGVLALGAVTTGVLGLDAASDLEDLRNQTDPTPGELQDAQSRAKRMFLATDILLGGALLVGGATLYFMLDPPDDSPVGGQDVSYRFGIGPGSVSISGTF